MKLLPNRLRSFPALAVPIVAGVLLVLPPGSVHAADEKCARWNTREFFENATRSQVAECLESGAESDSENREGATPLHLASAHGGDPAVIALLIEAGADPNARDDFGDTPLHGAARHNENTDITAALLAAGADPHASDDFGESPAA